MCQQSLIIFIAQARASCLLVRIQTAIKAPATVLNYQWMDLLGALHAVQLLVIIQRIISYVSMEFAIYVPP